VIECRTTEQMQAKISKRVRLAYNKFEQKTYRTEAVFSRRNSDGVISNIHLRIDIRMRFLRFVGYAIEEGFPDDARA
jgi:hypothetical protein